VSNSGVRAIWLVKDVEPRAVCRASLFGQSVLRSRYGCFFAVSVTFTGGPVLRCTPIESRAVATKHVAPSKTCPGPVTSPCTNQNSVYVHRDRFRITGLQAADIQPTVYYVNVDCIVIIQYLRKALLTSLVLCKLLNQCAVVPIYGNQLFSYT